MPHGFDANVCCCNFLNDISDKILEQSSGFKFINTEWGFLFNSRVFCLNFLAVIMVGVTLNHWFWTLNCWCIIWPRSSKKLETRNGDGQRLILLKAMYSLYAQFS